MLNALVGEIRRNRNLGTHPLGTWQTVDYGCESHVELDPLVELTTGLPRPPNEGSVVEEMGISCKTEHSFVAFGPGPNASCNKFQPASCHCCSRFLSGIKEATQTWWRVDPLLRKLTNSCRIRKMAKNKSCLASQSLSVLGTAGCTWGKPPFKWAFQYLFNSSTFQPNGVINGLINGLINGVHSVYSPIYTRREATAGNCDHVCLAQSPWRLGIHHLQGAACFGYARWQPQPGVSPKGNEPNLRCVP